MKVVYKFPLNLGQTDLAMPVGAQLLSVQTQQDSPVLWALVETTGRTLIRRFLMVGTGAHLSDAPMLYVATVQMEGGSVVGHLFEMM